MRGFLLVNVDSLFLPCEYVSKALPHHSASLLSLCYDEKKTNKIGNQSGIHMLIDKRKKQHITTKSSIHHWAWMLSSSPGRSSTPRNDRTRLAHVLGFEVTPSEHMPNPSLSCVCVLAHTCISGPGRQEWRRPHAANCCARLQSVQQQTCIGVQRTGIVAIFGVSRQVVRHACRLQIEGMQQTD
jgi:hypothetical protein